MDDANNCFLFRTFLRGKTILLVTHQLQYVRQADRVFLVNGGRLTMSGSYEQISQAGADFLQYIIDEEKEEYEGENKEKRKDRYVHAKQEKIALWTRVEENGSIHDKNGTWGMRLTMGVVSTIATGLSIGECMYAICLYCPPRPRVF